MRNKMKKSIVLGVTFICVLLFTCFLAFAEETKETKYVGYSISDITEYRGDIKKAPESPEGGYIFSGWYEKDTTTEEGYEALKATELEGMTEGTVYAKFVPEEVLSVKAQVAYQLSNDTYEEADEKGAIRFLTSVDSLNYQKVGFKIKIGNGTEQDKSSNAVYKNLYVKEMDGEGTTTTSYVPSQIFCAQSQYFKSHTYKNVTASTYRIEITVKPYWITLDGTQVEAPETNVRTMTVNDGRYWKYVHVDGATGNDETGAGTIGSPFKTINQALAEMSQCIEKQKQWNLYDGTNGTLVQADQWEVYMAGEIEVPNTISVEARQHIVLDTYGKDAVTIKRGNSGGYNGLIFNVKSDGKLTLQTTAKNLLVDGTVTTAGNKSRFANVEKDATVTVKEGVTFSNHTCTSYGGTFYVLDGGTLHVSKAEFMNNKVTGGSQGGAIYVNAGGATTITVSDSIFTGSTSLLGGAISFANDNAGVVGSLQVTGCTFNGNKVSGKGWSHGGAILIGNNVTCTLENNTFEGNTASALGNDVGMGTNAVLNLQGSQTDSFEIILMDQTGKIKVKEGFCPNTGAKISLISKVNRNEGNELIECANNTQAKEMVGYFDLQGDNLKTYALNDSAEKLILQTGGAIYKGTTYVSLAAAIEAVEADESTGQTATIEIIRALLDATVTIPDGYDITLTSEGDVQRTITRDSAWTEDKPMFELGAGSTLTFTSTSDSADNTKLLIDGKSVNKSASRLAIIPSGTTVNVGAGVKITNHTCTSHGGTFYVLDGGTLHISKAEFMNNKVTGGAQGGAIYVNAGGATTITVSDSIFTGNTSILGGAISFANDNAGVVGSLQVTGCTFNGNQVSGKSWSHGGAILIGNDVNCTLENNTFEGNTASALGNDVGMGSNAVLNLQGSQTDSFEIILMNQTGKIKVKEGFCPNTGAKISLISKVNRNEGNELIECANNTQAKEMVGYFDLQGDKLKTYALNDSAEKLILQTGGVIYNGTTYPTLAEAIEAVKTDELTEQTATIEIIKVLLDATVTIPDGYDITLTSEGDVQRTITRNSAWTEDKPMFELGAGSALTFASSSDSADNIKLLIDGKSINNNSSRLAIIPSGRTVNVDAGVEITNHTCKYEGGAFRVEAGGTLHISDAKFTNNMVTGGKFQGGAIYAETAGATPIIVSDSIFTGNTSTLGGAISFSNSSKTPGVAGLLQVTGCTFNENKVSGRDYSWGGAILIGDYVNCTLENNTFEGNMASALGNDVGMGKYAVLNLQGSQIDSFEIGLTDPTGKIKVEDGFTPNTGTEITLISNVGWTEGYVLIECETEELATQVCSSFIVSPANNVTYQLEVNDKNLVLTKPEVHT